MFQKLPCTKFILCFAASIIGASVSNITNNENDKYTSITVIHIPKTKLNNTPEYIATYCISVVAKDKSNVYTMHFKTFIQDVFIQENLTWSKSSFLAIFKNNVVVKTLAIVVITTWNIEDNVESFNIPIMSASNT